MCGIYGTTLPYSQEQIVHKLERTSFRGPDQLGKATYKTPQGQSIHFGHNRLSIIDLDPRSNQPFGYQDRVHLVFNGEIYNFKAIRATLEKKGYRFHTSSDTEVVCAAYLEYGFDCVHHFNGMFAFVIYDIKKQLFFGAKDRLGQKPFYYSLGKNGFEFASQLSSIALFRDDLTISEEAVQLYLTWNNVPAPWSIYNEIHKLEDAHCFCYHITDNTFKKWQYWDIELSTSPFNGNYQEAKEELEDLLKDAVKLRMYADVPLGVFLSGGVDSSLVAALATKSIPQQVKTFSVKFNEAAFDESTYSQQVAEHLGTDHHIIPCSLNEGLELVEGFSYYFDEPFADASAIPSMLLAKYTRQHVTVALSGDGADEAFLGYRRYKKISKINKLMAFPKFSRDLATVAMNLKSSERFDALKPIIKAETKSQAYLNFLLERNAKYHDFSYRENSIEEYKYLTNRNKDFYANASDFDLKTYLPWDINVKVDRATMAYSLEARSPFLDYRVIEFAQKLPTDYKYQKAKQKRIIKDILYQYAPEAIFDRQKAGFTMPFEVWFRNGLKEKVLDELSPKNLKEIPGIHPEVVTKSINQHMNGNWNYYPMIWKLLVLKQWMNNR